MILILEKHGIELKRKRMNPVLTRIERATGKRTLPTLEMRQLLIAIRQKEITPPEQSE